MDILKQPNGTMCGYIAEKNVVYWCNYFNSQPADFLQGVLAPSVT